MDSEPAVAMFCKSPTKLFVEKTALIDSNAINSGHTTTILKEIRRRSRLLPVARTLDTLGSS